jgi:hypothetical protein
MSLLRLSRPLQVACKARHSVADRIRLLAETVCKPLGLRFYCARLKGKPVVRRGRKASGLSGGHPAAR